MSCSRTVADARPRSSFVLACFLLLAVFPVAAAEQREDDAVKGRELLATGRYEAALPFLQRDLAAIEAANGQDSPALAAPLSDLAEANRLAGRLDRAEQLYRQALTLDGQAKRQDPVGRATTMNNLALVYREKGRLDEAERMLSQSLRLLEDSLGPNDARVAMGLHNLASVYRAQGRVGDARPLQERAVALADKSLGPRNPDTQKFRAVLAALGDAPAATAPVGQPPPSVPGKGALPPPPLDDEPAPAPRLTGAYAVQLAAVRAADQVSGEWQRLVRRYPDLNGLELQPAQSVEVKGKGTFYRVIAGPLATRAEAQALCARLKKAGAFCRPSGS